MTLIFLCGHYLTNRKSSQKANIIDGDGLVVENAKQIGHISMNCKINNIYFLFSSS
jgi:hypothetical protein